MTQDDVLKMQTYKLFENSEELYVSRDDVLKALQTEKKNEFFNFDSPLVKAGEAISRQAAIDACNQSINIMDATGRIKELPSVKPAQKVGRWEYNAYVDHSGGHCSVCGHYLRWGEKTNFCPDCGSRMMEEGE